MSGSADRMPAAFRAQMAALRVRYAAALPERIEALAQALHELRTSTAPDVVAAAALQRAHKLHGTAGSYGFEGVGDAAREIEIALRQLVDAESGAGVHALPWPAIDAALQRMRDGARQGTGEQPDD